MAEYRYPYVPIMKQDSSGQIYTQDKNNEPSMSPIQLNDI